MRALSHFKGKIICTVCHLAAATETAILIVWCNANVLQQRTVTLAPVRNQQRWDVGEAQNNKQKQGGFRANTRFVPNQSRMRINFIESHR